MKIVYHEAAQQFHLFNDKISYVMGVLPTGELGQIYYGNRIHDVEKFDFHYGTGARPVSCSPYDNENFCIELCCMEYPVFGCGDFRVPAYGMKQANGSRVSRFLYDSYEIREGKDPIPGLPATYVNETAEAATLIVHLKDALLNITLDLHYTIWRDYPIIARHASYINQGSETVTITKAMSLSLDLPDQDYDWVQFQGAWGRERYPEKKAVGTGSIISESMRGASSPYQNPFIILQRKNTDEHQGVAMGIHLVYSGNFQALSEGDAWGKTRVMIGINPKWFEWPLGPGERFDTPEALLTWTNAGLNDLSQSIHSLFHNNLTRGPYKNKPRPILLNNWEATEMDFDEEAVLKIAAKGKEAGVELFVLDDGWFGKRNNDYAGLGDWYVNTQKLPGGVKGLADKINAMGLEFGIWIEPEMVNEDSDLYRAHPDWVLATPDRERTLGRHQMVLDFSKPEVVDNIFEQLKASFDGANISYIKWDMNRNITECYSIGEDPSKQGMTYHKYILGVYSLYEKMIAEYPNILFESCASGGGRFDAGMLYYAPQAWGSDDTDGYERQKIQYGTSYGYPVVSIGAHVSVVPNLQTGRLVPISTRANVACFGTFGYELDLNELSDAEFEEVKKQIVFMKEYRGLLQYGDLYRIQSPFDNNIMSWMAVSKDKKQAVVGIYITHAIPNDGFPRVHLTGLCPDTEYVDNDGKTYWGDQLMEIGVDVYDLSKGWWAEQGDFKSKLIVLKAK